MKQSFESGMIVYHPVLLVATYNQDDTPNAMLVAWGGQAGENQIALNLLPHRTTENIVANGGFTVSCATQEFLASCDYVGIVSGDKVPDKLARAGFTVTPSKRVNAPIIDQLPVAFECKVVELKEEFDGTRVVGEVVGMEVDDSVLTDGKIDLSKVHPVVYDNVMNCYRSVGPNIADAYSIGKKFQ